MRTRVADEVFTVAEAHLSGIGLIHGPGGLGKTVALKALAAVHPARPTAPAYATTRQALAAVKMKLAGRMGLLIVDDIHKLAGQAGDRTLHVLRDLHDATGYPMLWCGTTDLVVYLEREQRGGHEREPLAQIRRRGGSAAVEAGRTADPPPPGRERRTAAHAGRGRRRAVRTAAGSRRRAVPDSRCLPRSARRGEACGQVAGRGDGGPADAAGGVPGRAGQPGHALQLEAAAIHRG